MTSREERLLEACQQALDYFVRPVARSMHAGVTIPRQLSEALAHYTDHELPLPWLRDRATDALRAELEARR